MAKPNYGFQKRQKQIAKQKKKEAKRLKKLENAAEPGEEAETLDASQARRLAEVMEQVKQKMSDLPAGSSIYALGADLVMNLHARTTEESLELAEGFLEQAASQQK